MDKLETYGCDECRGGAEQALDGVAPVAGDAIERIGMSTTAVGSGDDFRAERLEPLADVIGVVASSAAGCCGGAVSSRSDAATLMSATLLSFRTKAAGLLSALAGLPILLIRPPRERPTVSAASPAWPSRRAADPEFGAVDAEVLWDVPAAKPANSLCQSSCAPH